MNAGSITFSTELDNKELEKEYTAVVKKIEKLNSQINTAQSKRAPLASQSTQIASTLDAAKARLEYMKSGQEFFTSGSVNQQVAQVKSIQKDWNTVQAQVEKYDIKIAEANTELSANEERAGAVASELAAAGVNADAMDVATDRASKSMNRFALRVREVVRSALVFTLITQALAKFREWVGNVVATNAEASASVARLKAALLTLAQPLLNVIIPAFTAFVNMLTIVITQLARLVSSIFGTTFSKSKKSAKALYDQSKAIKSTGDAADDASKSLASFDQINQLAGADSSASSGTDSSEIAPDFSGLDGTDEYRKKIDEFTTYLSGAMLALGAILFFSGASPLLGLGLIMAGAMGLVAEAKEHWGDADGKIKEAINVIMLTLGGAALVIGAVLAFSGNLGLGIPLMAIGAATLVTAAAMNWGAVKSAMQGPIGVIVALVSGALLALGAAIAFSGTNLPLGIGLMAAGALGLIATAHLNWDTISTALKGPIGVITALVSTALLAFGAILAFTGANPALGIAMMIAGGAGLASVVAVNWDYILNKLSAAWGAITNWWSTSVKPKLLALGKWFADNVINPLLGGVESFINFFIDGLNWLIQKINSISFDLPDIMGGGHVGFNLPILGEIQLPRLATGAVIPPNREFMAVLGDQKSGYNIEAPLDLIVEAFRKVSQESSGTGETVINNVLELDGDVIFKNQKRVARLRGKNLLE